MNRKTPETKRIRATKRRETLPNAKPQAAYFKALDGFRGALCIIVAIYHTIWVSNINQLAFLNNGPVIIDLFFAQSGFLMFMLYADRIENLKQAVEFMKRRIARLYPLHLFMTAVVLAYVGVRIFVHQIGIAVQNPGEILPFQTGSSETVSTLISSLLLLHSMGLHENLSFNVPSWTISVEFFTYIAFAILMVFAKPDKAWHFCGLMVGALLIYFGLSLLKPDINITYDYGFARCVAGFLVGGVATYIYKNWVSSYSKLSFVVKSGLEALTLLLFIVFVIYFPGRLQFLAAPILLNFTVIFAMDGGLISRLMSAPIFRFLAKRSYSIYMVHFIIAVIFGFIAATLLPRFIGPQWNQSGLGGDLFLIPYLLTVVAISHFTQKYVEVTGGLMLMKRQNPKPATSKA